MWIWWEPNIINLVWTIQQRTVVTKNFWIIYTSFFFFTKSTQLHHIHWSWLLLSIYFAWEIILLLGKKYIEVKLLPAELVSDPDNKKKLSFLSHICLEIKTFWILHNFWLPPTPPDIVAEIEFYFLFLGPLQASDTTISVNI